jgi:hypothetical protein
MMKKTRHLTPKRIIQRNQSNIDRKSKVGVFLIYSE